MGQRGWPVLKMQANLWGARVCEEAYRGLAGESKATPSQGRGWISLKDEGEGRGGGGEEENLFYLIFHVKHLHCTRLLIPRTWAKFRRYHKNFKLNIVSIKSYARNRVKNSIKLLRTPCWKKKTQESRFWEAVEILQFCDRAHNWQNGMGLY